MTTSSGAAQESHKAQGNFLTRYLDPLDLIVEAIYTVLIVMTFTLAVNVADQQSALGHFLSQRLLSGLFLATFGCAVAWGLIDGVMYLFTSLAERGQENRVVRTIRDAATPEEGIRLAGQHLEESLAIPLDDEARASIERLLAREVAGKMPSAVRLQREDFYGAVFVFVVAVAVALPVVLPLLLVSTNASMAVRISNFVAFAMLFYFGHRWGRYVGGVPWTTGTLLAAIGVLLVMIAIPLGG